MVGKIAYLSLIGAALLTWWLVSVPERLAINDQCQPEGLHASVSARFNGQAFWPHQIAAARREREDLENEPAAIAAANALMQEIMKQANANMDRFYKENPEYQLTPALQQAQDLRDQADQIEAAEYQRVADGHRLERIETLRQCENEIALHQQ
jgi:hypothetical protein